MPRFFVACTTIVSLLLFPTQPVFAAHSTQATTTLVGNDISYPQCNKSYPKEQAFGIVGVNDGLANTTNPCLGSQLTWAAKSTGGTNQAKTQLYVNTANPGGLGTASWSQNNIDPSGNSAPNPYGICNGSNSEECSWQYGWNRAVEDVQQRFLPAAQQAGVSTNIANYPVWLDVETANSWESGASYSYQYNTADLEGMVSYFKSLGANVGLYSTSSQWSQIVGSTSSSVLSGLNTWLPGAKRLSQAQSNCSLAPLTSGGKVTVTQYSSATFDYDYSCI